jgi:hypothetical protein
MEWGMPAGDRTWGKEITMTGNERQRRDAPDSALRAGRIEYPKTASCCLVWQDSEDCQAKA